MARRTQPPRPPAAPPATADEGAAKIRPLLVKLFDRKDGTGADWTLLLESLFKAGFQITDERPDGDARKALMRKVYIGAYDRSAGNSGASIDSPGKAVPAPSNTGVLKSSFPKPS
jgi:hypothetical protein